MKKRKLRDLVDELQDRIDGLAEANALLDVPTAELESARERASQLYRELQNEKASRKDDSGSFAEERATLTHAKAELVKKVLELQDQRGELKSQLADQQRLSGTLDAVAAQRDSLRAECDQLTERSNRQWEELQKVRTEIEDMRKSWRPIPISHQWEPRDGRCALCDDHREHERHRRPVGIPQELLTPPRQIPLYLDGVQIASVPAPPEADGLAELHIDPELGLNLPGEPFEDREVRRDG